jgi:hypothetical protein
VNGSDQPACPAMTPLVVASLHCTLRVASSYDISSSGPSHSTAPSCTSVHHLIYAIAWHIGDRDPRRTPAWKSSSEEVPRASCLLGSDAATAPNSNAASWAVVGATIFGYALANPFGDSSNLSSYNSSVNEGSRQPVARTTANYAIPTAPQNLSAGVVAVAQARFAREAESPSPIRNLPNDLPPVLVNSPPSDRISRVYWS